MMAPPKTPSSRLEQLIQIFLYPDSGGYVAECPVLNAVTQGNTLEATLANLREVIELALEEDEEEVP